MESGTLEVHATKMIFQNFPLRLKLPCEEGLLNVSCSITLQLNSTIFSELTGVRVSKN